MKFEWDETKRRENLARHGLDFADALYFTKGKKNMRKKNTIVQSETDWVRVMNMTDHEIDTSDIPEMREDLFKNAHIRWPGNKKQLTLRLDPDVVDYFKHLGRGYQRTMNNVLRKYMEVHLQ